MSSKAVAFGAPEFIKIARRLVLWYNTTVSFFPSTEEETVSRLGMKTQVVDPQTVDDNFTRVAQAMWAMVWAMTGVNEEYFPNDVSPALRHEIERFGDHQERLRKGIEALTGFYRAYLGERGEALITEYFAAKWGAFFVTDDGDPRRTQFEDAQRALNEVHGGLIVDDYSLLRLTDEPAWSLRNLGGKED